MSESRAHKRAKHKNAGPGGTTEVRLKSGKRLDALSRRGIATEVERQGITGIRKAVSRLKEAKKTGVASGAKLAVPQADFGNAVKEMFRQGVRGRVQNMSNSRSFYVSAKGKPSTRRGTSKK